MTKKSFFFGIPVLVPAVVFGLVLAGCASTPKDPAAAAKLAADINAIKAGSAQLKGAQVKIVGGFVDIANGLTVPLGVTLDVTAEGAALGLHDSALTVNGIVNAGPWHIRLEDNASWGTITGSGTIYLKGKGSLLGVEGNKNVALRKLTLDGVTLVGLKDNDQPLATVNKGGEFVLKSGAITGNNITGSGWVDSGGVKVNEGGAFTMEGGEISGNSAASTDEDNAAGGGISVWNGSFTMTGGTISNNSAEKGGGVFIARGAVFIMEDGTISGNTVSKGGGGVDAANENTTFTMKGGKILGNTAGGDGGGVHIWEGAAFTMESGAISGNTAQWGGGVHVAQSTFTLKGGRIQGGADSDGFAKNTDSEDTGALHVYKCWPKWGTGGTYTKGGKSQPAGSNIFAEDWTGTGDTLIAVPKQ